MVRFSGQDSRIVYKDKNIFMCIKYNYIEK